MGRSARGACRAGILLLLALIPGVAPALGGGAAGLDVLLYVEESGDVARVGEMVRSGVPLPEDAGVTDPAGLYLVGRDAAGEWTDEVALQAAVTSRWGATADVETAPARWVRLDFPATVPAGGRAEYRLRYDAARAAVARSRSQMVTETGEALVVDTGALRFEIPKARFGLFENRTVRSGEIVSPGPARAFDIRLRDAAGIEYSAGLAPPREVVVEENGPLVAVVRVRGVFATAGGDLLLGGWVGYTIRLHAYAHSSFVRLFFTLENNGLYGRDADWSARGGQPRWLSLDRLSLDLDGVYRGETFGTSSEVTERIGEDGAGRFRLFQGHVVRSLPDQRLCEAGNFFYLVQVGSHTVRRGFRSRGVLRVLAGSDSVSVGVRHFWQSYPKALSFENGRLSVELWPAEGHWPDNPAGVASGTYQFEGGRHKTHEMGYAFGGGDAGTGSLAARLGQPLFARASADWYARSGAVGYLTPGWFDVGNAALGAAMARFEQMHEAVVDVTRAEPQPKISADGRAVPPISLVTQRESRGNAFRTSSDRPSAYPGTPPRGAEAAGGAGTYDIDHYGWFSFGDIPHAHGWSSLHHDWPYGMLLQYLRHEGMREFLDRGEEMVRHRYDIDQYHCRDETHENWWFFNGFQRFDQGWHGDDSRAPAFPSEAPPRSGHTWLAGLVLHHALTGDPRSLESARENADAFSNYYRMHYRVHDRRTPLELPSDLRDAALAILGLTELHEFTGEERYLETARAVYENIVRFSEERAGNGGFFFPGEIQDMESLVMTLEPLRRFHMAVQDPEILALLARILNRLRGIYLEVSGGLVNGRYRPLQLPWKWSGGPRDGFWVWSGFPVADAFAYLYLTTGDAGALEFARRLFHDSVLYFQAREGQAVSPEFESEISFSPRAYPFQESRVNAHVLRAHQVVLRAERTIAAAGGTEFRFPFDGFRPGASPPAADRRPPEVTVKDVRRTGDVAEITVVTDEEAFVQAEYGRDPRRTAFTARTPRPGRTHRLSLTGLDSEGGWVFRVLAEDRAGNAMRTGFRALRPGRDSTPPALVRVSAPDGNRVVLEFSEAVHPADAENPGGFLIEGAEIARAIVDPSGREVTLVTTPLEPGVPYRLTVGAVRDRARPPNAMPAGGTTVRFFRDLVAIASDPAFRVVSGRWDLLEPPFAGRSARPGDGTARGEWRLPVAEAGDFEVFARWPGDPAAATATARAVFTVRYHGGTGSIVLNQRALGGRWVRLGTFPFRPSEEAVVALSTAGANGVVFAGAVRLVYAGGR